MEAVVGEISHSEETAELPDEEKVDRRQAKSLRWSQVCDLLLKKVDDETCNCKVER